MKVTLINGSPRGKGCTYTALKEIENVLNEEGIDTQIIEVGSKPIRGCIGCGTCSKIDKCVFDDDIVNEVAKVIKESDGLIVGSPVHYAAASGAITSLMDRVFYSMNRQDLIHKFGASIVSCRRGGASATFDQLNKYFTISEMPIVSSGYWNQVHGNTPEEVKQDLEGLRTMRVLGRNMAYLLKCQEAAKNSGVLLPKEEERVRTNFIR